jgi:APA family basic amino acid/polyamine antiporter
LEIRLSNPPPSSPDRRHIGLWGATGIGVGSIVGGGILALAGTAFSVAGPSAVLAFALNGVIAFLTALSFAEVSTKFPQSGGAYTFAKRVLSVESAFAVGWVVWFASIVAAALYALGFGLFAAAAIQGIWPTAPEWISDRSTVCVMALAATALYALSLSRRAGGGGAWFNIAKLIVFSILLAAGFWVLAGRSSEQVSNALTPFFAGGAIGLISAMGFTLIALQGFDLIAAVAGEIRDPERNIPRAMLGSLGVGLVVYLPLLMLIALVGFPDTTNVTAASRDNPETIVAVAARHYLGDFGYWLVVVAAILSMLSALQANLFAASRVAQSMALDRTLPEAFARVRGEARIPVVAICVTAAISAVIQIVVTDISSAGAAASLIFLITFALVHGIAILVRRRSTRRPPPFRTPWFPAVPVVGGTACIALAIFQGFAVPSAGAIVAVWLGAGGMLFIGWFARGARLADDHTAARDPDLLRLRGLSPLVLVPIANPTHAGALVSVANALTPPEAGRVLLLSVITAPQNWDIEENPEPLDNAQAVLKASIQMAAEQGMVPESMTTIAPEPWSEIIRVAKERRCECLLLGLSKLDGENKKKPLNRILNEVEANVVVLRAPAQWTPEKAERILIPLAGHGGHDRLLVRLLSSLSRTSSPTITVLKVMPASTSPHRLAIAERGLRARAKDLHIVGPIEVKAIAHDDAIQAIVEEAASYDLLVLGTQRTGRQRMFGPFARAVSEATDAPLLMISRWG